MGTHVYIDGFNLYYRALRDTPYRWLNLEKFCDHLLPKNDVTLIRFFTARVKNLPGKPGTQQRQDVYLRALRTLPRVEVHEGTFKIRTAWRRLARAPKKPVEVLLPEEKGSDVNLASWLLLDGMRRAYDTAVIISNDSDLCTPIEMVRKELGLKVGVVNPDSTASFQLSGDFVRPVRRWHLQKSQFLGSLKDEHGRFHKPKTW